MYAVSWGIQNSIGDGFADVMPTTIPEITLTVMWMVIGVGFFAVLFSDFGNLT